MLLIFPTNMEETYHAFVVSADLFPWMCWDAENKENQE